MRKMNHSRIKNHFRNLSRYINRLIRTREWGLIAIEIRNRLIVRLNSLYRQLCFFVPHHELKKLLAAAVIFIGIPLVSKAQAFAPVVQNPFGFVPPAATNLSSPGFADLDNDGDQDMIFSSYSGAFYYYQNTGTPALPVFGPYQEHPFGLGQLSGMSFPALADIDNDGDFDLFVGSQAPPDGMIFFYENTGTASNAVFSAPLGNPFGLTPTSYFAIPAFADIDGDGDLDLFAGEYYGHMKFYKNTGTPSQPVFSMPMPDPFGITAAYGFGAPAFADTDHDGDLDLYEGEYYGNTRFFNNAGTSANPVFETPQVNPFGITQTDLYSFPAFTDIDNDGDADLMIVESYGNLNYFRNTEINVGIPQSSGETCFKLYPNPASDHVIIHLNDGDFFGTGNVTISDFNGRVLKSEILKSCDLQIRTDDLTPGIYLVQVTRNGSSYNDKLIVH